MKFCFKVEKRTEEIPVPVIKVCCANFAKSSRQKFIYFKI